MLSDLVEYLKAFFYGILQPILDFLHFAAFFFFDKFCELIEFALDLVQLPAIIANNAMDWAGLPPQTLYMLNAIGLGTGLNIITAALTARLLLNLIPSWASRV